MNESAHLHTATYTLSHTDTHKLNSARANYDDCRQNKTQQQLAMQNDSQAFQEIHICTLYSMEERNAHKIELENVEKIQKWNRRDRANEREREEELVYVVLHRIRICRLSNGLCFVLSSSFFLRKQELIHTERVKERLLYGNITSLLLLLSSC